MLNVTRGEKHDMNVLMMMMDYAWNKSEGRWTDRYCDAVKWIFTPTSLIF